ncbi:MAG: hypothetical protein U1E78_05105 [Gammaproteobacteria bacterium]
MKNGFEKHPLLTGVLIAIFAIAFLLVAFEGLARYGLGLGRVVVYDAHPIYGFRPKPNQSVTRLDHTVTLNEDGLRAHPDWAITPFQKRILFLGDSVTYGGSYINNDKLFSRHAAQALDLIDGNAAVNAWGVLNIHALITEMPFLPATTYVTVLPEGDFYRGLNRIGGQPFWTKQPQFALEEIIYYGLYKLNLRMNGFLNPQTLPLQEQHQIVNVAVRYLKEMDVFIKSKGYQHVIFITPSLDQAKHKAPLDKLVQDALSSTALEVYYLIDDVQKQDEIDSLFYDSIHLTEKGHTVWGELISNQLIQKLIANT